MKPTQITTVERRAVSGFTLIEILVVVLIILILGVISYGMTTRAIEQATAAADTGKFRQVAIALQGISQENNGIIPLVIPGTEAVPGKGDRYTFYEMIDRYSPPPPNFNPGSIYNYQSRANSESIFSSKAAKPWTNFSPGSTFKLPGPLWFSNNSYLSNAKWLGNSMKVPDPSKIVICAETNHLGGAMQPQGKATFQNNVDTDYRVSRVGNTALYLFLDGHVESLQGDRGDAYYAAHPEQTNIWKWW